MMHSQLQLMLAVLALVFLFGIGSVLCSIYSELKSINRKMISLLREKPFMKFSPPSEDDSP